MYCKMLEEFQVKILFKITHTAFPSVFPQYSGRDLRSLHKSNGIQFDMKKWLFIHNIVFLGFPCLVDQNFLISVTSFIRKCQINWKRTLSLINSVFVLRSDPFSNFNSINFKNKFHFR